MGLWPGGPCLYYPCPEEGGIGCVMEFVHCVVLVTLLRTMTKVFLSRTRDFASTSNVIGSSVANRPLPFMSICFSKSAVKTVASSGKAFALRGGRNCAGLTTTSLKCSAGFVSLGPNGGGSGLRMLLGPATFRVSRIIIGPGERGCAHGSGPTMRLVGGMVTRGGSGQVRTGPRCRARMCRGLDLSLSGFGPGLSGGGFLGGFGFVGGCLSASRFGNGPVLAISIHRGLSSFCCQGDPGTRGAVIETGHVRKVSGALSSNNNVASGLRRVFGDVGVFSGGVPVLLGQFIDPLSSALTAACCRCCVVSALSMKKSGYISLTFIPTGDRDCNFAKQLCVALSNGCTIGGMLLGAPTGVGLG